MVFALAYNKIRYFLAVLKNKLYGLAQMIIPNSSLLTLHFPLSIFNFQFSTLLYGWYFDAEGGAEPEFGAFDEDFAVVVFFDDAFGEG